MSEPMNPINPMNRAGQIKLKWTEKSATGEYFVDMTDFPDDASEKDYVTEMMIRLRLDQLNQTVKMI